MATIVRPTKEGGATTYQAKVALGFKDILASEVDADLDTIYAAWNGGVDTVNIKNASVTEAKLASDAHLWTISGTTLQPVDATKTVSVPGGAAGAGVSTLLLGSNTAKARIQTANTTTPPWLALTTNREVNASTQDDATKPSWQMTMRSDAFDNFSIGRNPPGGALTTFLTLDNAGRLLLPVAGLGTGSIVLDSGYKTTRVLTPAGFSANYQYSGSWVRDDTSKPGWFFSMDPANDFLRIYRDSGTQTALLTLDNAGNLKLTAGGATGSVVAGAGYQTERMISPGYITVNYSYSGGWVRDDTSKPGYLYGVDPSTDYWYIARDTGVQTVIAKIFGTGAPAGDLQIFGNNATKATGTTWINPSDPRLKEDIAPYAAGLAEICQLAPITYRLKAQPDGPLCYGFDASAVKDIFPECVSTTRMKLDPADEEETDDVLTFDMHPILVALINAVKELTARLDAIETRPG